MLARVALSDDNSTYDLAVVYEIAVLPMSPHSVDACPSSLIKIDVLARDHSLCSELVVIDFDAYILHHDRT